MKTLKTLLIWFPFGVGLLLVFLLSGCSILNIGATRTKFANKVTIELPDGKVEKITIIREFNQEELLLVKKSLRIVNYVNPELQFHHHVPAVFHWAKLKDYDGLTLFNPKTNEPRIIIIDFNDWQPTSGRLKNPFFILEFGKVCCHEMEHLTNKTKDPETSEKTEVKLNKILSANPQLLEDVITKIQTGYFDK